MHKSQIKHRGSSFCSMKCMRKYQKSTRKSKDKSAYKKRLWLLFSKYIRTRDNGRCISCGKQDDIRNMDAGHYIPKSAGLSLYFDERNVNCQCTRCNRFLHGNLSQYALALMKKYGQTILEELEQERRQILKISENEYFDLIKLYKKKLFDIGYVS